jgi:molybdopterin converting factor small subunit
MEPSLTAASSACPAGRLRVFLFAGMAAAAGRRTLDIAWEGGTAADLRRRLAGELPTLAGLLERSAVAIGDSYSAAEATIPDGIEVAIIPPVSGG